MPIPERGVGCFSNIAVPYDCDADATDKEGEWSAKKQVPDGWMDGGEMKITKINATLISLICGYR